MEVNWLVVWPSPFHFNYQQLFEESKKVNKFIGSIEHYTGIGTHTPKSWWLTIGTNGKYHFAEKPPKPIRFSFSLSLSFCVKRIHFLSFYMCFLLSFCFQITWIERKKNIVINQFNDSMILRAKSMPQLYACLCVAFVYVCVYLF